MCQLIFNKATHVRWNSFDKKYTIECIFHYSTVSKAKTNLHLRNILHVQGRHFFRMLLTTSGYPIAGSTHCWIVGISQFLVKRPGHVWCLVAVISDTCLSEFDIPNWGCINITFTTNSDNLCNMRGPEKDLILTRQMVTVDEIEDRSGRGECMGRDNISKTSRSATEKESEGF